MAGSGSESRACHAGRAATPQPAPHDPRNTRAHSVCQTGSFGMKPLPGDVGSRRVGRQGRRACCLHLLGGSCLRLGGGHSRALRQAKRSRPPSQLGGVQRGYQGPLSAMRRWQEGSTQLNLPAPDNRRTSIHSRVSASHDCSACLRHTSQMDLVVRFTLWA